ncbi:hypothetical protein JI721_16755 [Alicyclobacillus cycloheptanicus]|nr:hypothetical protein JI721_16755 [Alicyclobacillus cycloheptanicus]
MDSGIGCQAVSSPPTGSFLLWVWSGAFRRDNSAP